ncbi:MAG: cbb3-type cytochrome c oxidase subunit I, partial [Stenotrophobium sp.]
IYRGRVEMSTSILWTIGFMVTFTIGGMTGVMMAIPGADFVLHNSLFLIAHFHNVIIGGVLFGMFAAINYWFPKATGFCLNEFWGKVSFWFWLVGFWVAFAPLYVLGLMGITRRLSHFTDPSLQIWFQIAAVGAGLIFIGILAFLIQLYVSIRDREALRDTTGDPWDGRTLEWATSSPAPVYNFAVTPIVHERDAWLDMKQRGHRRPQSDFKPIHMPKNTATGIVLSGLSLLCGFGLIWHIWWLVVAAFVGIVGGAIAHTFNYHRDYYIPAEEVARVEAARSQLLAQSVPST